MDESRNNMREEFESWLAPSWSRDTYLEDEGEVEYVDDWVQGAWVGWQASRAAIEIQLPDSTEFDGPDMSGAQQAISQIRETLTETGIKVKS